MRKLAVFIALGLLLTGCDESSSDNIQPDAEQSQVQLKPFSGEVDLEFKQSEPQENIKKADTQSECSENLYINFDNKLFTIPRKAGGAYTDTEMPYPCDGILNSKNRFMLKIRDWMDIKFVNERPHLIWIEFVKIDSPNIPEDHFTELLPLIEENDQSYENIRNMPIKNDFHEFEYEPNKYVYLHAKEDIKTPQGNPFVFLCGRTVYALNAKVKDRLVCNTSIAWKDNISVNFSVFLTDKIPQEKWTEMTTYMIDFIEKIEVTDDKSYVQYKREILQ